jgi:hypothetical protein
MACSGKGADLMTTKALEAASKALVKKYHEYWPGSWPAKPEADGLSKAAIDTYLSTFTGEHGELVERLRAASNKSWEAEIKATEAAYAGKSGEWDIKGLLLVIRALLGDSTEAIRALQSPTPTAAPDPSPVDVVADMPDYQELIDHAFETVAKWHDKNAGLCLSASEDDPRLNADDRSRAYDAHRHHAASAAAIRLKLTDEKRALLRALQKGQSE